VAFDEVSSNEGGIMAVLRIYDVALNVVRKLSCVIEAMMQRDPNLADQMRRAATSIVLNIAEGAGARGRNKTVRYSTALGSAREVKACLDLIEALRYGIAVDAAMADQLDHVISVLTKWTVNR
jgi:four helix bundle protein